MSAFGTRRQLVRCNEEFEIDGLIRSEVTPMYGPAVRSKKISTSCR